jgi:hypothetical protein
MEMGVDRSLLRNRTLRSQDFGFASREEAAACDAYLLWILNPVTPFLRFVRYSKIMSAFNFILTAKASRIWELERNKCTPDSSLLLASILFIPASVAWVQKVQILVTDVHDVVKMFLCDIHSEEPLSRTRCVCYTRKPAGKQEAQDSTSTTEDQTDMQENSDSQSMKHQSLESREDCVDGRNSVSGSEDSEDAVDDREVRAIRTSGASRLTTRLISLRTRSSSRFGRSVKSPKWMAVSQEGEKDGDTSQGIGS